MNCPICQFKSTKRTNVERLTELFDHLKGHGVRHPKKRLMLALLEKKEQPEFELPSQEEKLLHRNLEICRLREVEDLDSDVIAARMGISVRIVNLVLLRGGLSRRDV